MSVRAALLLSCIALGQSAAQQKVNLGRAATPDIAIRLMGGVAKIRIVAWALDSVSITGFLPKGSELGGGFGTAPASGAKFFIQTADAQLPPDGALELRVPRGARLTITTGTADIESTGVTGELDLNVLGGSVHVTGSSRVLKVEGIDASVTVDGSADWVRLKTGEGDITMRGGSADATFTSVSGNIVVSDGALERAKFETISGNVTFAGDFARAASVSVDTHSGTVDMQFAMKAGVKIDALTTSGTIENFLGSKIQPGPGRDGRGQQISLSLGNGDPHVVISTFKGRIRLAYRGGK
jgi:hypothetical protein